MISKTIELADKAFKNKNWEACICFAKQSLLENPTEPAAAYYLATILHFEERHKEALAFIAQFSSPEPPLIFIKNLSYQGIGELEEAKETLHEGLQLFPKSSILLKAQEELLDDLKKVNEEKEALEKALDNPTEREKSLIALGDLSYTLRQYISSSKYYQSIKGDLSGSVELNYRLGLSCFSEDKIEDALKYFLKAENLEPNAVPNNYFLGLIYTKKNEHSKAKEHFEKVNKLNPNYLSIKLNLALLYLCLGEWDKAWDVFSLRPRSSLEEKIILQSEFYKKSGEKPNLPSFTSYKEFLNKKVILVAEQGLGDQLFFLRFAEKLQEKGVSFSLLAEERMCKLLKEKVDFEVFSDLDFLSKTSSFAFLGDLPLIKDLEQVPPSLSLKPDESKVKALKSKLDEYKGEPILALSWRAGVRINEGGGKVNQFKEVELKALLNSLKEFRGKIVVIQRFLFPDEWSFLQKHLKNKVLDFSYLNDDLDDMLAFLSLADHHLCVSNTNLHLREALGKKSWVLVPSPWEWRWCLGEKEATWFPNCRVIKQEAGTTWEKSLKVLEKEFKKLK
jgi:tetratricopeptide (TPR) repeat protein